MKTLIAALLCLMLAGFVAGCAANATGGTTLDPAKVATAATQITSLYFAQQQSQINLMTPGAARDKAQAQLFSNETTAALATAIGQVVVNGVTTTQLPAVVPATQPVTK